MPAHQARLQERDPDLLPGRVKGISKCRGLCSDLFNFYCLSSLKEKKALHLDQGNYLYIFYILKGSNPRNSSRPKPATVLSLLGEINTETILF